MREHNVNDYPLPLIIGCLVFWHDPDNDECSGVYRIGKIKCDEDETLDFENMIFITDGFSEAEVPLHELSVVVTPEKAREILRKYYSNEPEDGLRHCLSDMVRPNELEALTGEALLDKIMELHVPAVTDLEGLTAEMHLYGFRSVAKETMPIHHAETGKVIPVPMKNFTALQNKGLIWNDGRKWLYMPCADFWDVLGGDELESIYS